MPDIYVFLYDGDFWVYLLFAHRTLLSGNDKAVARPTRLRYVEYILTNMKLG